MFVDVQTCMRAISILVGIASMGAADAATLHGPNQMRAAVNAVDHSRGLVALRPLGHLRPRASPPLRPGEPAELGRAPHSLGEALCALTAVEARLCTALRDQERLKLDNERLMQSLELASRRAVAAQRVAHHDRLTGLPNRLFLIRRLQQAITAARQQNRQLALLFIDLDGFKAVNPCAR